MQRIDGLTQEDLWLIYHAGIEPLTFEEIKLSRSSWESRYNSPGHNANPNLVFERVENGLKTGLFVLEDEALELAQNGQEYWETLCEPQWSRSYQWNMREANQRGDFQISIYAPDPKLLFKIVATDINVGNYGFIFSNDLVLIDNVSFAPLYWRVLHNCWELSFNALCLQRSPEALGRLASYGIFEDLRWYKSFASPGSGTVTD